MSILMNYFEEVGNIWSLQLSVRILYISRGDDAINCHIMMLVLSIMIYHSM